MNFQQALTALKDSRRVSRDCWGQFDWVYLIDDNSLVFVWDDGQHEDRAIGEFTHEDVMADDWVILD